MDAPKAVCESIKESFTSEIEPTTISQAVSNPPDLLLVEIMLVLFDIYKRYWALH